MDTTTPDRARAITGWTGIACIALSGVILLLVPPWPAAGATGAQLLAYYAAHRTPFLVGNYVAAVASLPGLFQVAGLAHLVKQREGEGGWLWLAVLATVGAVHGVGLIVLALYQALAFVARAEQAAVALSEAANVGFGFFFVAVAAAAVAVALAIARTRVVAGWLAPIGWVCAVAALGASTGALWPAGALAAGGLVTLGAFGMFCTWVFVVSVALLRPAPRAASGSAARHAAGAT